MDFIWQHLTPMAWQDLLISYRANDGIRSIIDRNDPVMFKYMLNKSLEFFSDNKYFNEHFNIYLIYVARKGCQNLFNIFLEFAREKNLDILAILDSKPEGYLGDECQAYVQAAGYGHSALAKTILTLHSPEKQVKIIAKDYSNAITIAFSRKDYDTVKQLVSLYEGIPT
jgi:hypothetical protein